MAVVVRVYVVKGYSGIAILGHGMWLKGDRTRWMRETCSTRHQMVEDKGNARASVEKSDYLDKPRAHRCNESADLV